MRLFRTFNETRRDKLVSEIREMCRSSFPNAPIAEIVQALAESGARRFPPELMLPGELHNNRTTFLIDSVTEYIDRQMTDSCRLIMFSPDFYKLANPDVAGIPVSPWLHYQVFGRMEGRSPHPLISIPRLAYHYPEVTVEMLVDTYLRDSANVSVQASNYVDMSALERVALLRRTTSVCDLSASELHSCVNKAALLIEIENESEAQDLYCSVGFQNLAPTEPQVIAGVPFELKPAHERRAEYESPRESIAIHGLGVEIHGGFRFATDAVVAGTYPAIRTASSGIRGLRPSVRTSAKRLIALGQFASKTDLRHACSGVEHAAIVVCCANASQVDAIGSIPEFAEIRTVERAEMVTDVTSVVFVEGDVKDYPSRTLRNATDSAVFLSPEYFEQLLKMDAPFAADYMIGSEVHVVVESLGPKVLAKSQDVRSAIVEGNVLQRIGLYFEKDQISIIALEEPVHE